MGDGQALVIQLHSELGERLGVLTSRTGRTPAELAEKAFAEYLAIQEWPVGAIQEATREADEGAVPVEQARVVARMES